MNLFPLSRLSMKQLISILLISAAVHSSAAPSQIKRAGVKPIGKRPRLIDDFHEDWRVWAWVSPDNLPCFDFKTFKLNEPAFFGPQGADLALEMETTVPGNSLAVVMETDQWRSYTGRKTKRFTSLVKLSGSGRGIYRLHSGRHTECRLNQQCQSHGDEKGPPHF